MFIYYQSNYVIIYRYYGTGGESLIIDAVKEIREVEQITEREIATAEYEAKEAYNQAIRDAENQAEKLILDTKHMAREIIVKKEAEANEKASELLAKGEEVLSRIKTLKDSELEEAVNFVVERIVI